jgi:hypothetical protein
MKGKPMSAREAILGLSVCVALVSAPLLAGEEHDFVSLFDGKTFAGWEGDLNVFRIDSGAIVAGSLKDRVSHNDFLCTTQQYDDFELRLEAKLVGPGDNAGVQFRSQRMKDHFELIGYQCDMGSSQNRPVWGALYDESRRRKFLAEGDAEQLQKVLKPNGWNELIIRCQGPHIQIWVGGNQTVDYVEQQADIPRSGIIGLQIHGGPPAEASYKNIRIKKLSTQR